MESVRSKVIDWFEGERMCRLETWDTLTLKPCKISSFSFWVLQKQDSDLWSRSLGRKVQLSRSHPNFDLGSQCPAPVLLALLPCARALLRCRAHKATLAAGLDTLDTLFILSPNFEIIPLSLNMKRVFSSALLGTSGLRKLYIYAICLYMHHVSTGSADKIFNPKCAIRVASFEFLWCIMGSFVRLASARIASEAWPMEDG